MDDQKSLVGVCQGCMISGDNMKSIMEPYGLSEEKLNYKDMFKNCYKLEVGEDSSTEEMLVICAKCIKKLSEAWLFRNLVIETQEKLKIVKKETVLSDYDDIMDDTDDKFSDKALADDQICEIYIEPILKCEQITQESETKSEIKAKIRKKLKRKKKIKVPRKLDRPIGESEGHKVKKSKTINKSVFYGIEKTAKDCNICKQSFTSHNLLIQHMTEHYPNYICNICGKAFLTNANLKGHLKRHDEEQVQCDICEKTLKKSSMRQHLLQHGEDRKPIVSCQECGTRFLYHSSKKRHMRDVHNHNYTKHQCDVCGKDYASKSVLKNHRLSVHEKRVNTRCNICGKGFFNKYKLDNHMLKHTGIREYACQICSKAFLKKYTLQEHMKIHNNVKNFVCTICSKAFTYKCSLKGHINMHHPDSRNKNNGDLSLGPTK